MAKPIFKITAEAKNNKAVIRIVGMISYWNNHAAGFKQQLDQLIADGITDADIYINSGGGDCFEANEIANEIRRFSGKLTAYLGALCASAATYVASVCDEVVIAENTSYMIHKPFGDMYGNSDELRSYLKLLDNLEKQYANTYSKKTGLSVDKIKDLWKADYWMDAEEAVELGFANRIEGSADVSEDDVQAMASYKGAPKIAATAKPQDTPKPQIEMKETVIMVCELDPKSTDSQVVAHLTSMKAKAAKADALQAQLDEIQSTAKDEKAELVVAGAIKDKKILASQKDFYKKNLIADFDGTKAVLDALPAVAQLSKQTTGAPNASGEDRSNWTYGDYQDKNPSALADLATHDEEKFRALYKAHYGVDLK